MVNPSSTTEDTQTLQTINSLKVLDTSQEERFVRITKLTRRLLGVPIAMLRLIDENRFWFEAAEGIDMAGVTVSNTFCESALNSDTVMVVEDATKDARFRDEQLVKSAPGIRFYAGCPLDAADGMRRGTLCVLDTEPRKLSAEDIDSIRQLGHMIEDELKSLTMATTDELTKLTNWRGFRMIAEPMIALCQRAVNPATLAMFDLDGLKQINDRYGHQAGDVVIKEFAKILLKVFRNSDVVARVGGDEFCVLLTDRNRASTTIPLERLCEFIDAFNAESGEPYAISVSAGSVAFDRARHSSVDDLLRDADIDMYLQKRQKRSA